MKKNLVTKKTGHTLLLGTFFHIQTDEQLIMKTLNTESEMSEITLKIKISILYFFKLKIA